MLHSLQYYACCYALLCFLHQQQLAASLTIIIDGATTNEWATRDEYKRMLEASNELETSLVSQQQQQQQEQLQDQLLDYQQQQQQQSEPPPALPLPIRHLTERGSAPRKYCGRELMDALELVCQGRFYNSEIEPQIVEPITKTKRASRLRALSTSSSFQSPQPQPPVSLSSSSSTSSSSSSSSHHLPEQLSQQQLLQPPPKIQSDSESDTNDGYPAINAGDGSTADERSRLQQQMEMQMQQLQAQLPSHLTIGGHNRHRLTGNDNNNDGDTINNNYNINPLTNKQRNRYNRMVLSRRVRGASEECCKRSCELDVLTAYCQIRDPRP